MEKSIPDKEKDFTLISRFLDFDLSEAELKAFEERMEKDEVLQERFRIFQQMGQHIDQTFRVPAKEEIKSDFLKTLSTDNDQEPGKVRKLSPRRLLSIAAAIGLLLMAGLWWINQANVLSSNIALADHYWEGMDKAHLFEFQQRSEDTDPDPDQLEASRSLFQMIKKLGENQQFAEMVILLEGYKDATPPPIPFEDDVDWLLAIAYLGDNQLEYARIQLENIIRLYPLKKEQAEQMLAAIQNLEEKGSVKLED